MFDYIMQQLPSGWKLEILKKHPKGVYHVVRVINRLEGCIYQTESEKSIDDAMKLMKEKIDTGEYL